MSGLRQRVVSATPSPPVDCVQGLSAALKQAKEAASASGVSPEELSHCVTGLVKTKLTPRLKNDKKSEPVPKKSRSCCSRLYYCFKVVWIMWLCFLAVSAVVMLHRPSGHLVHNLLHRHMYSSIIRPVRLAIIAATPYLEAVGWNVFASDCFIINPLVNESMSCPCMYIKECVELQLNQTHRTMPRGILSVPNNKVYVLRGAVEGLTDFSLDVFEQYQDSMFPGMCFEMPGDSDSGVQLITELFNKSAVKQYLDQPKQPWTYSWQECPSEENPLTLHSLLPPQEWLPPGVAVSNSSYFTLGSQWAKNDHSPVSEDITERFGFVAVLVIFGEVRVLMESANINCQYNCMTFSQRPVLGPGDILLFDQTYWDYYAVTWTRASFTSTVNLTKH